MVKFEGNKDLFELASTKRCSECEYLLDVVAEETTRQSILSRENDCLKNTLHYYELRLQRMHELIASLKAKLFANSCEEDLEQQRVFANKLREEVDLLGTTLVLCHQKVYDVTDQPLASNIVRKESVDEEYK